MCILLNSGTKTWPHAKYLCNFNKASLLFIQNENEQNQLISEILLFQNWPDLLDLLNLFFLLQDFLKPLMKYRFTSRPYIWLDAITDNSTKDEDNLPVWNWSDANQKVSFCVILWNNLTIYFNSFPYLTVGLL